MEQNSLTSAYEALPKIAKIIIQILTFYLFCGIYRIVKYAENQKINNLLYGILAFVPFINVIAGVLDIYSEATQNKITYFVE